MACEPTDCYCRECGARACTNVHREIERDVAISETLWSAWARSLADELGATYQAPPQGEWFDGLAFDETLRDAIEKRCDELDFPGRDLGRMPAPVVQPAELGGQRKTTSTSSSSCRCCICRGLEGTALVDVAKLEAIADRLSRTTELPAHFKERDVIMIWRLAMLSAAVALRHELGHLPTDELDPNAPAGVH